jgi:hypothetical protein
MRGGDFATDGEWILACPEAGEPHELRVPKHPFSPAQGVTCERGHVYAWLEARKLVTDRSPLTRRPFGDR